MSKIGAEQGPKNAKEWAAPIKPKANMQAEARARRLVLTGRKA